MDIPATLHNILVTEKTPVITKLSNMEIFSSSMQNKISWWLYEHKHL